MIYESVSWSVSKNSSFQLFHETGEALENWCSLFAISSFWGCLSIYKPGPSVQMFNVHITFKLSWQLWHCCSGCTVILWGQLRPKYPQKITLQPQQLFHSGQLRWSTGLWTFTKCDSFTHHLCKNVGPRKTWVKFQTKATQDWKVANAYSTEWKKHWEYQFMQENHLKILSIPLFPLPQHNANLFTNTL